MSAVNGPLSDLPIDKGIHTSVPGRSYIETASVESVERFRDTLQLTQQNSAQNVTEVQQTTESEVVRTYGQIDRESLALANERALRGENVVDAVRNTGENGTVVDISRNQEGDMILDGLSALRDIFDSQTAAVANISSGSLSGTEQLIATQLEIVKFSLLMDVTSKLTGKSTQTFDTLMKGQ